MFIHREFHSSQAGAAGHPRFFEGIRLSATARHREKELIYAQGDEAGDIYIVEFGCVRVSRITLEGRRLVTGFYFAGEVFGFETGTERQCYAEALEYSGTRTFHLEGRDLANPRIAEMLFDHLESIHQHLLILGTQNAIERVAAFLVGIADRRGVDGPRARLPMSRCDIADHLGLTLETVSRAMHRLQALKLIRLVGAREIVLLDRDALIDLGA
ncbi:helix-turn-helix domain-containing protein [Pelagibacterium halotolerans]|uniref:Transcriptional regulator, Crp/Fnr family n=1 Tax=Pelagibacterium halotolerans (strain DSM 22347 / JCM 15775 / CGMCC 1.7692 / B2) TaxID=1082931 RepID=G4RAP1_PELHB|nr:helix-turn-helix domain-containing protein [Pelagibacterium halotolerans]AEQ52564.1 transcriptional regulator, Crp/Fnr family [Pelagibacterium halotolerans B2]QJR17720.1 helix-turn-helix domain-containing protein [Pelagibacterium halotolerans]SEA40221.1 CRP/FNR family transcriptional regulator, nitrogen fixation regulation protein [Pelagibacterium halotolerans]